MTSPRGRKGLSVSAWICSKCGTQRINNGFKRIYNIINENSANNHRLAYKKVLLSSINSEKNNDQTDNKMEQCLEKESNNKGNKTLRLIKANPRLFRAGRTSTMSLPININNIFSSRKKTFLM